MHGLGGCVRPARRTSDAGFTLLEVLLAAAIGATLTSVAVAQLLVTLESSRTAAAARFLASRMAQARAQAAVRSATVALRFDTRADGVTFTAYVDGNRNGVRTMEIASAVDRMIDPPVRLASLFPGVSIALSSAAEPDDAVRIGTSDLLSFTPAGTATSGTIYLRGRNGTQYAVRVFGPTARARVLRVDPRTQDLIEEE